MSSPGNRVPLFSIITVCRNAAELIAPTIKSLASQDFRDYEYIVVDGASTDRTVAVVEECAAALHVRIVSEPDSGIFDAMNKGIRLAQGTWLYYLNAGDDFVDATVLSRVARALAGAPDCQIAFGDVIYRGESGERLVRFDWVTRSNLVFERLCHQAVFARRDAFDLVGQFDTQYKFNADFDWLLRLFRTKAKFLYLDLPIAFYDDGGVSARERLRTRAERATIKKKYLPRGLAQPLALGYRVSLKVLRLAGLSNR